MKLHPYSQTGQTRHFGNASPAVTSILSCLQFSARVSFPLLPTGILFGGARSRTESEPWHHPPTLGSLSLHMDSCWPVLSHAWHGGKKTSQQSQISSANQLKRKWYQAQPIHWNDCSRRNYYPVIIQIIMFTLFLSFFPINFSTNFIQNMLWKEKRGVEGEGEGRRLFPGWQAEAHPSWSCEIFWLKMDSCKHVAKGHKCISR